jgi:hypothetical protein
VAIAAAIPVIMLNLPKSSQPAPVEVGTNANTPANPNTNPNTNTPKPNIPPPPPNTPETPETKPSPPSESNYDFLASRLIGKTDLDGFSEIELDLLRNAIFARHGRRFKDAELQTYFEQQSWYRPVYEPDAFPDNLLTDTEKQNVQFIVAYQKNLAQHQAQNPCYNSSTRLSRDPTSPLNVRSGAGTEFAITGQVPNGVQIKVIGEQKGWLKISDPISGWVAKSRTGCSG